MRALHATLAQLADLPSLRTFRLALDLAVAGLLQQLDAPQVASSTSISLHLAHRGLVTQQS